MLAQFLSSFDGSFGQNRSFKSSISFSSKFLTKREKEDLYHLFWGIDLKEKEIAFLKEQFCQKLLSK